MKTKLRPYKGVYKIPIHRHTAKRYAESKWLVYMSWFGTDEPADPIYENGSIYPTHPLVTDLKRCPMSLNLNPLSGNELNER